VTARALLLAAAVAAMALAFALHPPSTPGPALRDFESYYAAGATWRYHGDAYGREVWRVERKIPGVVATRNELLPFVGPPFGLPLWDALARLPWDAAIVVWGTVVWLAFGALALASLRLAGSPFDPGSATAALVVAGAFGPLTSAAALGQAATVSCAAIVAFPLLLGPRRTFAATAAALVAALQPNLAVALIAKLGPRRAWIAGAFAATLVVAGSYLALASTTGIGHYADVLRDHAAAERFIAIQTTVSAVARGLGASAPLAGRIAIGAAFVALVGVAVQLLSRRYGSNAGLGLACAALPLALPFAHEHDFTVAFFPALLLARRARGVAWVAGACASLLVAVDWLGLAQRPQGLIESTLLAVAGALALAVLAPEPLRPYHLLPLLVAGGVALAGAVAAAHPLPVWPDALPFDFHPRPTVPAPLVWHAEQVLSGIATNDPVWAWLRSVSLAGCALLWLVASFALLERPPKPATAQPS
jgi:hypothetical protein